jgi:hypothetical protein
MATREAMNQLLPLVYDELHRLACGQFRRERGDHTLQATALVNEAYMRMCDQRAPIEGRSHFLALAATQMRRGYRFSSAPRLGAIRIKPANDAASIFRIIRPRCSLTVGSPNPHKLVSDTEAFQWVRVRCIVVFTKGD